MIPLPSTPRTITKPTIDDNGNWIERQFIVWRDEKGVHDRMVDGRPPRVDQAARTRVRA